MQTTENDTPAPILDYESQGPRLWRAGTLVYTSAGLVVLFCWLLWGDFAWSMKERAVWPLVSLVLKKLQASDLILGLLVVSLPAVVSAVLGPIISYRSDRHRGPLGRRIPYLLITTPIMVLATLGLAFSSSIGPRLNAALGLSPSHTNHTIIILFGSSWALFECATVVAYAMFNALANDVVPRALIGRFFGWFRAISLIAGIIFNFWLISPSEKHYITAFTGVAVLYGVGLTLMCWKVKEGRYPPPPPVAHDKPALTRFADAVVIYFRECFSRPYYICVFLAITLGNIAFVPVNSYSIYFYKSLSMSTERYGNFIALTYFISLFLAVPLGFLADRFHPVRVSIIAQILYALSCLYGAKYAVTQNFYAVALVAHGVLSGCYYTTSASLGQRLFPHSRFAQFASAAGMIQALATLMLGPILGEILDRSGHFYRYTFSAGFIISTLAFLCLVVVNQFMVKYGGAKHYVAPE